MPIACFISFDNNPEGVYYAGQELSGVVELRVDTTKRIKCIYITVSGYAKIRWVKKGYPRDSERATCRAFRSYLSSRSYVLGTCASNSFIDWTVGNYSYTFNVVLPENLPTSFEGKYGQVHYEILATIERSGRYPKIYRLPFTVIHPLDLNVDAIHSTPLEILQRKQFWSFCCPTGPLTIKFSTPYCGYAPGQKIHFVLYINNESSIDITACEVKLKQEVTYEANNPQHEYRHDRHLIAKKQFGNVLRWSRKVYHGYLDLPAIPPTSTRVTCPITVSYAMKIIVNPTEFHWKLKIKVPITVGSLPIIEQTTVANEIDYHMIAPTATATAYLSISNSDNPPDYVHMLPPSYSDAMELNDYFYSDMTSVTTNSRTEQFKPRYPVYCSYETPIIPPETLYDDVPAQLQIALCQTSDLTSTVNAFVESNSETNLNVIRVLKEFN